MPMRRALAVAAKAPIRGRVKTRLHSILSPDEATELYRCFLKDTVDLARRTPGVDILISYSPEDAEHLFNGLFDPPVRLVAQRGDGLGEKLNNLVGQLVIERYQCAVIIDSDSPTLPASYLRQAFIELERPGDRVVLGPATDGGYYLVGQRRLHPQLFEGISWSTGAVLEQTIERARAHRLEYVLLPPWFDVDDLAGFERLCEELLSSGDREGIAACNTKGFLLNRPHLRATRTDRQSDRGK